MTTNVEFKVGEEVTLEVKNNTVLLPSLFPNLPKTRVYAGKVLARESSDEADCVRITGDKNWPIRAVAFCNILKVNGKKFTYKETKKAEKPKARTVEVAGSKGNVYTVTIKANGSRSCTCVGFGFNHKCKHLALAGE